MKRNLLLECNGCGSPTRARIRIGNLVHSIRWNRRVCESWREKLTTFVENLGCSIRWTLRVCESWREQLTTFIENLGCSIRGIYRFVKAGARN